MLFDEIKKITKYRFNLNEDKADENEIVESIKRGVEFKGVNLWTLIFAIFIASIGLNTNSTAVIIGAMLISPLMGPIMGIGLGAAILDLELIKKALKNLLFATVIALLASSIYFFLSPLHEAKSELLARTNPTIWDVLIALFGGLTGIIEGSRKNIGNAIPGVAIATALMPPLCTAGFGLAIGNFTFLIGAFYLYLINCFFICLSTYWIIKLLRFKKVESVNQPVQNIIKRLIIIFSVAIIAPTLYFGYVLVKQELFTKNANEYITNEIISDSLFVINKKIKASDNSIELVVLGDDLNEKKLAHIKRKKNNYGLEESNLIITNAKTGIETGEENYSKIIDELFLTNKSNLSKKDSLINILKKEQFISQKLKIDEKSLLKEFNILFGKTNLFSVNKTIIFDDTYKAKDTLVILYVNPKEKTMDFPKDKIKEWLKARTKSKEAKVIIE
ncbi:MAG: TIGR00341 family protein [Bacteroidetes bacterium]|nr:TIGR00341 family protein [Bacteroidota bacterium]